MKRLVLSLLLVAQQAYCACSGSSPLYTSASAALSDVQDCVNLAVGGDTVKILSNTPTAGTWSLTYGANTASGLANNISASALSTALNALASITSDGGVTVTGSVNGSFIVTWVNNGVRATAVTGSASGLTPTGLAVDVTVLVAGDGATKEVRKISIGNSWTTFLHITKAITLQGQTTISGGDTPINFTASDQTIILDDSDRGSGGTLIAVDGGGGGTSGLTSGAFRMTGITFRGGISFPPTNYGSTKLVAYPPATCRIDHCDYDSLEAESLISTSLGNVLGVMDHNIFYFGQHALLAEIFNPQYGGGSNNYGDGAWAAATGFGGSDFFFIETNLINNPGTYPNVAAQTIGAIDCYYGGKYVARYNYFYNAVATNHGSETPGRARSSRAIELYNNTHNFNQAWAGSAGLNRGGVMIEHDEAYIGNTTGGRGLESYRSFAPFVFPAANGAMGFDLNADTADHTGNGFGGGVNGLYASGTASTGTLSPTLTVAGTPWTTNQWVGYMVTNTDINAGGNGPRADFVVSNTSSTITTSNLTPDPGFDAHGNIYWSTGNHYQIYKAPTACFDQCGRGVGDLMSGDAGTGNCFPGYNSCSGSTIQNTNGGGITWLHEALEPCYAWNEKVNGSPVNTWMNSTTPSIVENRDFYNNTPMPGYTPYTYPHPLVGPTQPMGGGWMPFM